LARRKGPCESAQRSGDDSTKLAPGRQIDSSRCAAPPRREMEHMIAAERKLRGKCGWRPAWTSIVRARPTRSPSMARAAPVCPTPPAASPRSPSIPAMRTSPTLALPVVASGRPMTGPELAASYRRSAFIGDGLYRPGAFQPRHRYVGTGEDNNSGDSYYGAGILKSADGGATWTQLAGPFVGPFSSSRTSGGGARIAAMAVDPVDPNVVLAAVDRAPVSASGIYRTSDGGQTWTLVLGGAVGTDAVFNPSDPTIAYVALGSSGGSALNGVYKSTDTGATWKASGVRGNGFAHSQHGAHCARPCAIQSQRPLCGHPESGNSLFGTLLGMFKSTDGGRPGPSSLHRITAHRNAATTT